MLNRTELEQKLQASFADAEIKIIDLAGDDNHYRLEITSSSFDGQSRIAQHRLVNAALGEFLGGKLHALQIVTKPKN